MNRFQIITKAKLRRKKQAEQDEKNSKKQRVPWRWDAQSTSMKAITATPISEMTFKQFLDEARYYKQKEDWQDDVDEYGAGVGVCPRCKGKAKYTHEGGDLSTARSFWECQDCGHVSPEHKY